MEIGVVTSYSQSKQAGSVSSSTGDTLSFNYLSGQSLMSSDDLATPQLTGKHEQPNGYGLKLPEVGDAVVYKKNGNKVVVWGYAKAFVDLVERKHGSNFKN